MKRILSVLLLCFVVTGVASAQDEWQIVDEQNVQELFEADIRGASISPDGTMLAGTDGRGICILDLTSDEENCSPLPDLFGGGLTMRPEQNPLVWSWDSRSIAFTENLYINFIESDLWVFDTESGTYTNRTDDGAAGGLLGDDMDDYALDYLPAYAPNGDLYFFRGESIGDGIGDLTLTLMRLPADADEPELVADLSRTLPTLSIFYSPMVSPDGTQMVFPVAASDRDDERNGIWTVDLTTGEAQQWTDREDAALGMPTAMQEDEFYVLNPVWTADSAAVVYAVLSPRAYSFGDAFGSQNYHYLNVETGDVKPIFDLTNFPEGSEVLRQREDGYTALIDLPREGAVSADGTAFVYLRYELERHHAQLAVVPLPPLGSEPTIMGDVELEITQYTVNPLMSESNQVLLAGWLYTLEQEG